MSVEWQDVEGKPGWQVYLVNGKPQAVVAREKNGAWWQPVDGWKMLAEPFRGGVVLFERTKTIEQAKAAAERAVWENG